MKLLYVIIVFSISLMTLLHRCYGRANHKGQGFGISHYNEIYNENVHNKELNLGVLIQDHSSLDKHARIEEDYIDGSEEFLSSDESDMKNLNPFKYTGLHKYRGYNLSTIQSLEYLPFVNKTSESYHSELNAENTNENLENSAETKDKPCLDRIEEFIDSNKSLIYLEMLDFDLNVPEMDYNKIPLLNFFHCNKITLLDLFNISEKISNQNQAIDKILPKTYRLIHLIHELLINNDYNFADLKESQNTSFKHSLRSIYIRLKVFYDINGLDFKNYHSIKIVAKDLIKASKELLSNFSDKTSLSRRPKPTNLKISFSTSNFLIGDKILRFINFDYSNMYKELEKYCEVKVLERIRNFALNKDGVSTPKEGSGVFRKIDDFDLGSAVKRGLFDCSDSFFEKRHLENNQQSFFTKVDDAVLNNYDYKSYFVFSITIRDAHTRKFNRNQYFLH